MKKLFVILLALSILCSLAACGGSEPESRDATPPGDETIAPVLHQLSDLLGVWEFSLEETYLLFYEDSTWETITFEGEKLENGAYKFDGQQVILALSGKIITLTWDEDGDLADGENNLLLLYVCDFESEEYRQYLAYLESLKCYFEDQGYEINYAFGDDWVFQNNGAFLVVNNGQHSGRMDVIVKLEQDSFNDTKDGYVEIEFTKTVYMDCEGQPDFVKNASSYTAAVTNGLYDYYRGYVLRCESAYGDSSRGDNAFYYEYESQGRTICVDYNYSTEWEQYADGSVAVITHNFIRMPADYDGIIYAVTEAYPDFATYAQSISGNPGDSGENIATMQDSDVQNAIFCRVHTTK